MSDESREQVSPGVRLLRRRCWVWTRIDQDLFASPEEEKGGGWGVQAARALSKLLLLFDRPLLSPLLHADDR